MGATLLNANQARHVATHLQLLVEELGALARHADLADGRREYAAIERGLEEAERAARRIGEALELPLERRRDLRRLVVATAGIWAMRSYELEPTALSAYGVVDPRVLPILTPLTAVLRDRLFTLSYLAAHREPS